MKDIVFSISSDDKMNELFDDLKNNQEIKFIEDRRKYKAIPEIIIALGSAGVFTALFQIISSFIKKNESKKICINYKASKGREMSIEISGYNIKKIKKDLKEFLSGINPELPQ